MTISSLIDENISRINENWYNLTIKIFNESPFKKGIYLINNDPVDRSFIVDDYDPITGKYLGKFGINLNKNATFQLTYLEFVASNREYFSKSQDYFDKIRELTPDGYHENEVIKFDDITSIIDSLIQELSIIGEKLKDNTLKNYYESIIFQVVNRWKEVQNPNLIQFKEPYLRLFHIKIQETFELKFEIEKFEISNDKLELIIPQEHLAALIAILLEAKIFRDRELTIDFVTKYFWVKHRYKETFLPLVMEKFHESLGRQTERNEKDVPLKKISSLIQESYNRIIKDKSI